MQAGLSRVRVLYVVLGLRVITEIYSCGHRVTRKINPAADPAKVYSSGQHEVLINGVCLRCSLLCK